MDIPVIQSDQLRLRPFGRDHLTESYVAWLNDAVVVRYSEQRHRQHTLETCAAYAAGFAASPDSFIAIEANGFGHIGNMTVSRDTANGIADLSIMIGQRDCWGRGYATGAWVTVMQHLFWAEGIRKITAGTMAENQAMLSLMQRTGMYIEGRRAWHFLIDNREVDLVMAAAFANSWRGQNL